MCSGRAAIRRANAAITSTVEITQTTEVGQYASVSDADIAKYVIGSVLKEVQVTSGDVDFSKASPVAAYSFEELAPGQCIFSSEAYEIAQGEDALAIHITWAEMAAQLKVGLINEQEDTIYAIAMTGGSATTRIGTENIPSGKYYVAVLNGRGNSLDVFGAIAYSWEKY